MGSESISMDQIEVLNCSWKRSDQIASGCPIGKLTEGSLTFRYAPEYFLFPSGKQDHGPRRDVLLSRLQAQGIIPLPSSGHARESKRIDLRIEYCSPGIGVLGFSILDYLAPTP